MFQVAEGRGFIVTFENGFSLSVQWGPRNYCSNRDLPSGAAVPPSRTAEVAVINQSRGFVPFWGPNCDRVKGWVSAEEVATLMGQVAALPKEENEECGFA